MSDTPLRVVSWNVNSIRARQARVVSWLERHEPDVVLLQETRCDDAAFAAPEVAGGYRALGYEVAHHGVDHRNGVAVLSRVGLDDVAKGFPGTNRPPHDEPRALAATCGGLRVWSVYAPNGRELDDPHYLFKLVWFERLRAAVAADLAVGHRSRADAAAATIVAGDFNVAPADADIYDPKRWRRRTHASPPERAAIDALLDLGLADLHRTLCPQPDLYTWWSHRPGQLQRNRGLRIDLALGSPAVLARSSAVWVDTEERAGERASDHAPLVVDLA